MNTVRIVKQGNVKPSRRDETPKLDSQTTNRKTADAVKNWVEQWRAQKKIDSARGINDLFNLKPAV